MIASVPQLCAQLDLSESFARRMVRQHQCRIIDIRGKTTYYDITEELMDELRQRRHGSFRNKYRQEDEALPKPVAIAELDKLVGKDVYFTDRHGDRRHGKLLSVFLTCATIQPADCLQTEFGLQSDMNIKEYP